MKKLFLILSFIAITIGNTYSQSTIDLSGQWMFSLNPEQGFDETITLPGTMDENHKGEANHITSETTRLMRRYSYAGTVWYRRVITIPNHKGWKREDVWLTLERTKPCTVYVDGDSVSYSNDISTPQAHCLGTLKPGNHILTIKVDNAHGIPQQLYASSHAICEDTQTNWNGIIGNITLSFANKVAAMLPLPDGSGIVSSCAIIKIDHIKDCFKNFHIKGQHFYANGHEVFLRGKHDACVWPKTGYCPMDVDSWLKYFKTCQDYGINHIRFHSWCPPDAAFAAADSLGIYLQPELPFWGDFNEKDTVLMSFLKKEGENILNTYRCHPSFVMFALGNELWGSIDKMKEFVDDFREIAPDILYTFGSNYYLGYQGVKPGMDYFTTCRIGGEAWGSYNTHTRGSFSFADAYEGGMLNHFRPNTMMNFENACSRTTVPIISHETGQFQSYPDYAEIAKYDSTIFIPYNLLTFRNRLKEAGMLDKAIDFHRASGRWAWELYKADIEMDLRTKNMAGFQLLDLQDYPGQGSAYVGIMDAFMDSKGYGTADKWRQFCSPVVPLLEVPTFCYEDGDTIKAKLEIANYSGKSLKGKTIEWQLMDATGNAAIPDGEGLLKIPTEINIPIKATKATSCHFTASIPGTPYKNSWELWIYPQKEISRGNVIETTTMTPAIVKKLEKGASVLWSPDSMALTNDTVLASHTVGGLFMTDYWNYRMFKTICENNHKSVSPGTLGILTHPDSPLFNNFPTEEHTNWQWWALTKFSHPLILDGLKLNGKSLLVQVIDNIERNHKLGLVTEFTVGKGRLLICMSDLHKADLWPEGRAFHQSVLNYMNSTSFNPTQSFDNFRTFLSELYSGGKEISLEKLENISQY